jgi:hypothetical protein
MRAWYEIGEFLNSPSRLGFYAPTGIGAYMCSEPTELKLYSYHWQLYELKEYIIVCSQHMTPDI